MADDPKPQPEIWVKVVEAHALKTWMALTLVTCAGISLVVLTIGAVWNNIQNPTVTDLSANYMTLLGTLLGSVFTGTIGYIAGATVEKKKNGNGSALHEGDLTLNVNPPEPPPNQS